MSGTSLWQIRNMMNVTSRTSILCHAIFFHNAIGDHCLTFYATILGQINAFITGLLSKFNQRISLPLTQFAKTGNGQ
jgi:hypothetical protein